MNTTNQTMNKNHMSAGYMIRVSIFSALAFLVMYVEFPIAALFPAFLQIDFSDVLAFIGGVTLGPLAVVLIELIKNLLHLILNSSTGGVGELANFSVGVALILPAVLIYKKKKSIPSLIVGFIVGIVSMVIVASVGNYYIFLPFYGVPGDAVLENIIAVYAPFNVVKGLIVGTAAIVLHQSIKRIYKYIV